MASAQRELHASQIPAGRYNFIGDGATTFRPTTPTATKFRPIKPTAINYTAQKKILVFSTLQHF